MILLLTVQNQAVSNLGLRTTDLDLQNAQRTRGPEINRGNGGLSRSIHPSLCSYSDGGQLPDRGLSGLGLRWRSGRVIAPEPLPPFLLERNLDKEDPSWFRLREIFRQKETLSLRDFIFTRYQEDHDSKPVRNDYFFFVLFYQLFQECDAGRFSSFISSQVIYEYREMAGWKYG